MKLPKPVFHMIFPIVSETKYKLLVLNSFENLKWVLGIVVTFGQ